MAVWLESTGLQIIKTINEDEFIAENAAASDNLLRTCAHHQAFTDLANHVDDCRVKAPT